MLTYYCRNCWEVIEKDQKICPYCGYEQVALDQVDYEEKLIATLHHSVPERRVMAAEILGNLESLRAMPVFQKIVSSGETNYFFLRAVLLATAKIDHPLREQILQIASQHPSILISDFAKELIGKVSNHFKFNDWDNYPG